MPAAPRHPRVPVGADALRLDVEALRLLVSRPVLAKALWSRAPREAALQALDKLHGDYATLSLKVSHHALSTAVNAIDDVLNDEVDYLDTDDARLVVDMVDFILSLDTQLDTNLQKALLIAFVHAASEFLPFVQRDDLGRVYRRVVDIIRDKGWIAPEVSSLKKFASGVVKAVSQDIFALDRRSNFKVRRRVARSASKDFHQRYPISKICRSLHEHARILETDVDPLWIHEKHEQDIRGAQRRSRNGVRETHRGPVPDFFSDDDVARETLEPTNERQWNSDVPVKAEPNAFSPMHTDESEDGSREEHPDDDDTESVALNEERPKRLSRKRARSSLEEPGAGRQTRRRSRTMPSVEKGSESRWQLRPRKVPQGAYEESDSETEQDEDEITKERQVDAGVDLSQQESEDESLKEGCSSFTSQQFNDQPEVTDRVTRHSRTRSKRRGNQTTNRTWSGSPNVVDRDAGPVNGETYPNGVASDAGGSDTDGDEIERSNIAGPAGETLRDLQAASARLKESGMPDPLEASVRDARRARARARRSQIMRYSPDPNGRPASPIPGSETPLQRKRRTRMELHGEESSGDEQPVPRGALFHGRILRTGRFQIYEDDLLIEGLAKYGWGMWTEIAKNFGPGRYTRAPMSLKDRARTMGLDPLKYPIPQGSAVKRGRPSLRPRLSSHMQHDTDEEEIQSPLPSKNQEQE